MYFIDFGHVDIWSADLQQLYRTCSPGDFFGEVSEPEWGVRTRGIRWGLERGIERGREERYRGGRRDRYSRKGMRGMGWVGEGRGEGEENLGAIEEEDIMRGVKLGREWGCGRVGYEVRRGEGKGRV